MMANLDLTTDFPLPISRPNLQKLLGLDQPFSLVMTRLGRLEDGLAKGIIKPTRMLSPAELEKYRLFNYAKRRLEWFGGRLAAKAAVLSLLDIEVSEKEMRKWRVLADQHGRPFYSPPAQDTFSGSRAELSISHSHGLAAALTVRDRACGLDIQKISKAAIRVKEKFCHESEESLLLKPAPFSKDPSVGLNLLWAAKEALRKLRGGHPLTGFMEMKLAKIETVSELCWLLTFQLPNKTAASSCRIVVFLYEDFACAIAAV